jgi:threonine/homoserine/homoserine lactone efflux protein
VNSTYLAFVAAAALLIVVPGPDVLLVIRNAVRGRAAGVATATGTVLGLAVHGVAAAVGLSALLASSAEAFLVVKLLGAAYLVFLGVQSLRAALRRPRAAEAAADVVPERGAAPLLTARMALRQGLLTNALNPKVAVFFLAFLPQFVPAGAAVVATTALLATIFAVMTAVYLLLLVGLTTYAAAVLARPAVRRWFDGLAGAVLLGFGVRLATTR